MWSSRSRTEAAAEDCAPSTKRRKIKKKQQLGQTEKPTSVKAKNRHTPKQKNKVKLGKASSISVKPK